MEIVKDGSGGNSPKSAWRENPRRGIASSISSPEINMDTETPQEVDTKAPIESVKHVVSKFGGIVDWKAHRVQTFERRKFIGMELEKAQEDIPVYKQNCADAEEGKAQVLKELEITQTLIDELKLNLEKLHTEEQQTKHDSDQAKLEVEKLEKEIADTVTFSSKAQLEVAKAKHHAALAELKLVKDEFEKLQSDFSKLASERDAAIKKAEEAVAASKELEQTIEDFTNELTNTHTTLDSANAEHIKGEELRGQKAMELNQEVLNLEKDLKEAEEELERLNSDISSAKELKMKLDAAFALLESLKGEYATYMESNANLENDEPKTHNDILAEIESAKKDLEQVIAHQEVAKAKEEAKQAKAEEISMESRLLATQKEIEAAKNFEKLALAANEDSENAVTLSLEEYLELNKKANEADELEANNLRTLEEMEGEIVSRKEALQIALKKAEIANEGKLKVEQELKKLREKHEKNAKKGSSKKEQSSKDDLPLDAKAGKKKKKLFPKFFMFMSKKKSSSSSSSSKKA